MAQTIQPLEIKGPIDIRVVVTTGSGTETRDVHITEAASFFGADDTIRYQAGKAGAEAYRKIAAAVVTAAGIDDPKGFIARATAKGQPFVIKTAEEITADLEAIRAREKTFQFRVVRALQTATATFDTFVMRTTGKILSFLHKFEPK